MLNGQSIGYLLFWELAAHGTFSDITSSVASLLAMIVRKRRYNVLLALTGRL